MERSTSQYPSTKFVALTDSESIESTKRNFLQSCCSNPVRKMAAMRGELTILQSIRRSSLTAALFFTDFTWLITVTVLFGVTVGFLCHKLFIGPNYFNETLPRSLNDDSDSYSTVTTTNPIPKLARPKTTFREKDGKDRSEFPCEQTQPQLEAIPLAVRKRALEERYPEDMYHYISTDLLAHYERTISKHDSQYLKSFFNNHLLKLSAVRHSSDFLDFLRGLSSNKFKFYVRHLKMQKFQLKLQAFDWFFTLTEELNHWYNYLDRLWSFLSEFEQQTTRTNFGNVTDVNFATFTEETQKRLFRFAYPFSITEKKLAEINDIINEWAQPLRVEFDNHSLTLFNTAVLLSEVNEKLQALNASGLENVNIFASRMVYLNANLELLGVSLAIIAPRWEFVKKIKINLDGVMGADHSADTASAGQPGKPGNPGGNGGDFLGVGSFQEKFLIISTNGGEGGRGQNGAKGHDGLNNTFPTPPFDKPACSIQVKTFKNLLPPKITHYEIYSEEGCGGSGTNGGVGGIGGHGGTVTLISKNSVKITRGLNGGSGLPGKGGPGGAGGRNGCFYEAIDEDDEFLHPVTTIKCPDGNVLPSGQSGKDNYNTWGQIPPKAKENLSVRHCIHRYVKLAREYFVKYNDLQVLSFLKELNTCQETKAEDVLSDFKSIDRFDRIEYYQLYFEKLCECQNISQFPFDYLKSVVLGEMMYLKNNVNYLIVDVNKYINIHKTSMNESFSELQAVSYFKSKVEIKFDILKQNLKLLKVKLTDSEVSSGNRTKYSSEAQLEKRLSCIMRVTIDIIAFLLGRSNEMANLKLNNSLSLCSMKAQPNRKSSLSENHKISALADLANAEGRLLRLLPLFVERNPETRENLLHLKDILDALEESNALLEEKKDLLRSLIDEVEHFIALYYFLEWEGLAESFSKSLSKLTVNPNWNASTEFLKTRFLDVMAAVQLKLGDVSRQNFHSVMPPKKKTLGGMFTQINLLRDFSDQSPLCKNRMQAIFDKNSTVGEFFSWTNTEIKDKLKILFSGAEINLKSNLINRHVLGKSFLQFSSLKLDFNCLAKDSICGKLRETLSNFKIDLTHSGYSYYSWEDETHVVVSEKVTLSYSFKTRDNHVPELYNTFFKKCQDGEIKLSPFTTWTVRLIPVNEDAKFCKLAAFADVVSLNLVGTGTYTV